MAYGVVLGIAYSEDFLTLYFFYEVLTLTTLPLVMHAMDEKARYAGRKYLVYSLSGAAFAFIGIVFLLNYGVGHLNFTYGGILDQSLAAGNERTLELVFVAAFFGFGVKAAVFPFHAGCRTPRWHLRRCLHCSMQWRWSRPAPSQCCG